MSGGFGKAKSASGPSIYETGDYIF
jgi:hypothetical protein